MKKALFTATVVKTHIMQFHLPYLKMLQDLGWETAVASKNDYENSADLHIPYCDTYYDIPFAREPLKKDNLRAYRELTALLDKEHYDLIHCHTPVGAILTRLAARKVRKLGTKVIYTAHGFHFFKGAPLKNWLLYFPAEWFCSFFTDVLITINSEDYAFAQKHLHPKKVVYVPGVGVNLGKFGQQADKRQLLRQSLGIGENDFLLLSVAELTKNKNHTMILSALAELDDPHIKFISAGRGECMEALRQQTKELGLEDRVKFLGYRTDAGALYSVADAFVFPSFREGLSLALMEAMASGLPSIVGAIRGNVDLISDGVEGVYTELTPAGIAAAIVRLYDNPALRADCAEAAKKKVQAFGLEPVLEQVRKIYLETVEA